MKKAFWIILVLVIALYLTGCKDTKPGTSESSGSTSTAAEPVDPTPAEPEDLITITLINEVEETDIWILPDTKENRKLSVWGTATLPAVKLNEERVGSISAAEGQGTYLLHMITPDHIYYGVSDIPLEEGYTIRFYIDTDPIKTWYVEVKNANNKKVGTYEVFCAAL